MNTNSKRVLKVLVEKKNMGDCFTKQQALRILFVDFDGICILQDKSIIVWMIYSLLCQR